MSKTFIGVDAGGTHTRVLVATADGTIIRSGRVAGANRWSSGTTVPDVVASAIRAGISGLDPMSVARGVIAIAGAASIVPELGAELNSVWAELGLPGTPDLIPDVVAAYAAGTTATDGVVLVGGTGSIAASVSDGRIVRRSGGHGWIVGDEGSAVWLGSQGIRAALRAIDGRGPRTSLTTRLPEELHIEATNSESIEREIVAIVHSQPPARLGEYAPIVVSASADGDRVAHQLVEAAADHLIATALAVVSDGEPQVLVLAGSLLTKAAPIHSQVKANLAHIWPHATISDASSGEAGAVALAISRHTHRRLHDATLARLRGVDLTT